MMVDTRGMKAVPTACGAIAWIVAAKSSATAWKEAKAEVTRMRAGKIGTESRY